MSRSAAVQLELTITESNELAECEAVIEEGLRTFVDVGNALLTIRDGRLYRDEYSTFEAYCRERWGWTRRHANRTIAAAEVVRHLGPMGPRPAPMTLQNGQYRVTVAPANERQIRPLASLEPEQQREAWAQAVETAPEGKVTGAHVERIVDKYRSRASQAVAVTIFSSETNEYYTPPKYIEAAREVMGGIDLDPASCKMAQEWIGAAAFYTEDDDGLNKPWFGRVWLNPPYGKDGGDSNQDIWAQHLIGEYEAGNVAEAVLLVKAALGYNWFERLWWDWPVCFGRERLSFIRSNGDDKGKSKQGTAFLYLGENVDRFRSVFRHFGRVIMPDGEGG